MQRFCILCTIEIFECMGSVLARDIEMWRLGLITGKQIRELCGKCALQQSIKNYCDIPFTNLEKQIFGL